MRKLSILALMSLTGMAMSQVWSGPGGAIPDATTSQGVITTQINVPALLSLSSITVQGLTHTWAGDVYARVTSPDNVTYTLFARIGRTTANGLGSPFGDSSDFGGDYMFVAAGGNDIWAEATARGAGEAITPGTYNATGEISGAPTGLFPGGHSAGNWTISLEDWAGGDTGSFSGWQIRGTVVPEPATMAVLGLGAVALIRRRKKA